MKNQLAELILQMRNLAKIYKDDLPSSRQGWGIEDFTNSGRIEGLNEAADIIQECLVELDKSS
jgi:hypothetical protein